AASGAELFRPSAAAGLAARTFRPAVRAQSRGAALDDLRHPRGHVLRLSPLGEAPRGRELADAMVAGRRHLSRLADLRLLHLAGLPRLPADLPAATVGALLPQLPHGCGRGEGRAPARPLSGRDLPRARDAH